MGWSIVFAYKALPYLIENCGMWLLVSGGISYTIGAALFGLGKKLQWMHAVFHIFVVLGSLFQYLAIVLYLY